MRHRPLRPSAAGQDFYSTVKNIFKPKGSFERVIVANYVKCAYWIKPEIATHLSQGKLVELSGRIGVNAYKNQQGEAKANLTFHVNAIKFHGNGKLLVEAESEIPQEVKQPEDDLPF